ncbi:hypothetical protein JAAARDRAFT_80728 [Jaapia argillacea MUCL 33604]|uniref:Uncharacterized protein n=1 Tax=Jaapia argillacea MUCL 33604 TaxID=933084 RepID=A0A067PEH5_9AGAM|nr:hypothetical protein JAAARDRAFT_80728 [Jaapia argillacea MUCL 33604]
MSAEPTPRPKPTSFPTSSQTITTVPCHHEHHDPNAPTHHQAHPNLGEWNTWTYLIQLTWIVIMTVWPWAFLAVAAATPGGLALNNKIGNLVNRNPTDTTWIVTNITNVLAMVVAYLFSSAARTLAIKWIGSRNSNIWTLAFISAARSPGQALPWLYSNRSWLLAHSQRLQHAFALVLYFALFFLVLGGFNSLLTPHPITRTADLTGQELDFTSTSPDCVFWFENNALADDCNWLRYNGSSFTTCLGENQMVDVLESGRSNVLSAAHDGDSTVTFNQLGGLRFSGPIRGVLPSGPNGVSVLEPLSLSTVTDEILNSSLSYEYTANLQGLASNVSCIYDTESPIVFTNSTVISGLRGVTGSCPPGHDVLGNPAYPSFLINSNFLGYYACNASSTDSGVSYNLYFRGDGNYNNTIGNVTCLVSSARHAIYDVSYSSQPGLFSARPSLLPSANNDSLVAIDSAIRALGELVWNSQWLEFNSVAESIITFGVKDFDIPEYARDDQNLRILESMIQGVLEYEVTYGRLIYAIYNSGPDMANDGIIAPSHCLRNITGSVSYNVTGWHMTWHNPLFLIPMTVVNLTSLAMLITAAFFVGEWKKLPRFDPSNPISVLIAASRGRVDVGPPVYGDIEDVAVSHFPIRYVEDNGVATLRIPQPPQVMEKRANSTSSGQGHSEEDVGQRNVAHAEQHLEISHSQR